MGPDTPPRRRVATGDDLRARLAEGEAVLMPGVWDALSARLAVRSGLTTVFVSGYCVAGSRLGVPDVGLLTQTEVAQVAREVCAAVPDALVVVDADTAYGDEMNTARTVQLWEDAGATGLFLEDQRWPKRCGHMADKQVVERDEWLAKLRTSIRHREHLFVTARTDARGPLGLAEAIERGRMAADLGVDAVFVEAPESIDELAQISAALPSVVLVANMVETGRTPLLTPDELRALGFTLIVSPVSGLFSMVRTLERTFALLASEGTLRDQLDGLVSFADFTEVVGLESWRALVGEG